MTISAFSNYYFAIIKDIHTNRILARTQLRNLVTQEAIDYLQNVFFKGVNYNATWYCGLKSTGTPSETDTLSNHPTWTELTDYQEGQRPSIMFDNSLNGLIANNNTPITFTINGPLQVSGLFITNAVGKNDTNGILFGVGDFPKILTVDHNILEVTVHIRHKGFYFWEALPYGSYSINLTGTSSWVAPHIPIRNTVKVWYNGLYQEINNTYTLTNSVFTFNDISADDVISVFYHYMVGGDDMAVGYKRDKFTLLEGQTQIGLTETPDPDSVLVFVDGWLAGKDDEYTIDQISRTITFNNPATGGEKVEVVYVVA